MNADFDPNSIFDTRPESGEFYFDLARTDLKALAQDWDDYTVGRKLRSIIQSLRSANEHQPQENQWLTSLVGAALDLSEPGREMQCFHTLCFLAGLGTNGAELLQAARA